MQRDILFSYYPIRCKLMKMEILFHSFWRQKELLYHCCVSIYTMSMRENLMFDVGRVLYLEPARGMKLSTNVILQEFSFVIYLPQVFLTIP